jgi:hypothetical protein
LPQDDKLLATSKWVSNNNEKQRESSTTTTLIDNTLSDIKSSNRIVKSSGIIVEKQRVSNSSTNIDKHRQVNSKKGRELTIGRRAIIVPTHCC